MDFALEYAAQIIEDFTDKHGLLAWEVHDEYVEIDAVRKIHPFEESVALITSGSPKKPYKPQAGEYFIPKVRTLRSNGHIQTFSEWAHRTEDE